MNNETIALIAELEQRVTDLDSALELVTGDRDKLQRQVDMFESMVDVHKKYEHELTAIIDRLRLHIQQGIEL